MNWPGDNRDGGNGSAASEATTARTLRAALRTLEEEFSRLLQALEDRPPKGDPALVDRFENAATDRLGELAEARAAAEEFAAQPDARHRALAATQERVNHLGKSYFAELAAFDPLCQLQRLGRERGGEWQGWARAVKMAVESCAPPLAAAQDALFACWRDLSAGATSRSSAPTPSTPTLVGGSGGVTFSQPIILPDAKVFVARKTTHRSTT